MWLVASKCQGGFTPNICILFRFQDENLSNFVFWGFLGGRGWSVFVFVGLVVWGFFVALVHYFCMQLIFMDADTGSQLFLVLRVFLPCSLSLISYLCRSFSKIASCISCSSSQFPPDSLYSSSYHFYVHQNK